MSFFPQMTLLGMKGYALPFVKIRDADARQIMPTKNIGVISSSSREDLGRFALAAETTRLLGQVLRHVSTETSNDRLCKDGALLLDGALRALNTVVEYEGNAHRLSVMNQTALCSM